MKRFLGRGMLTETENENWRKHHKFFQPGFDKKYLSIILSLILMVNSILFYIRMLVEFMREIDYKVDKLIERLRIHALENRSFKLNEEIYTTIMEIIADVIDITSIVKN